MDYWYGTVESFDMALRSKVTWMNVRWFYRPVDIQGANAEYVIGLVNLKVVLLTGVKVGGEHGASGAS